MQIVTQFARRAHLRKIPPSWSEKVLAPELERRDVDCHRDGASLALPGRHLLERQREVAQRLRTRRDSPGALMLLVFGHIFKARVPGLEGGGYIAFLALGMWPWFAFSEAVTRAASAVPPWST